MKPYRSKFPAMMKQYNIMLEMARDKNSTLYNPDGSQHGGAGHRNAFWRGYNFGEKYPNLIPARNTLAYPCFRAGMDFKKEGQTTQKGEVTLDCIAEFDACLERLNNLLGDK